MGAGLSTLFGMGLTRQGHDVKMINFGQSKIFDDETSYFSTRVWPEQYRVVNYQDFASFFVPSWMGFRFQGTEIY